MWKRTRLVRQRIEALLAVHDQPDSLLATQVVAHFDAERQALAIMDHPNIAKMLDTAAPDVDRLP